MSCYAVRLSPLVGGETLSGLSPVAASPQVAAMLDQQTDVSEKMREVAGILALGLQRLNARKSSPISPANRDSPLDFQPGSHRHGPREHEDLRT